MSIIPRSPIFRVVGAGPPRPDASPRPASYSSECGCSLTPGACRSCWARVADLGEARFDRLDHDRGSTAASSFAGDARLRRGSASSWVSTAVRNDTDERPAPWGLSPSKARAGNCSGTSAQREG
jgi:hypothetical protein